MKMMRRTRKLTKIKICVIGFIIIALCLYFKEDIHNFLEPERRIWIEKREILILHYRNNISFGKYFINENDHSAVCHIPKVDPFEESALKEWSYRKKEHCNVQKYGIIENNRLVINTTAYHIHHVELDYIIRGRKRKEDGTFDPPSPGQTGLVSDETYKYNDVINDDFHVHFKKPSMSLTFDAHSKCFRSLALEHDFIRLRITKQDGTIVTEYHTHITDPNLTCRKHGRPLLLQSNRNGRYQKKKNHEESASSLDNKDMNLKETGNQISQGLPYNVHMIMIDAQSLANMHRQTPKLMAMLEQDENAMLFKAHGIHGDGTTCQLLATLAGEF